MGAASDGQSSERLGWLSAVVGWIERLRPRGQHPAGPGDPLSSKTVESIDQSSSVSPGTPATACRLTGDRFTSDTAAMGNDLSTLPNFPAEIRAPGHPPPRLEFQLHFADHDVLTPGCPRRARRDEPCRAQGQPRRRARGATIIANTDEFGTRTWPRSGMPPTPRGRVAFVARPRAAADLDDGRGARRLGVKARKEKERVEEHVRARSALLDVLPPHRRDRQPSPRSSAQTGDPRQPTSGASPPAWPTARPPEFVSVPVGPAPMPAGTYRNITGNAALALGWSPPRTGRLPLVLGLSDHPGLRHPARCPSSATA